MRQIWRYCIPPLVIILAADFALAGPLELQLEQAVRNGTVERAEELLEQGADVKWNNPISSVPLLCRAITRQDTAMVQLLLKHGAAVEPRDTRTAINWATKFGTSEIVAMFLDQGTDLRRGEGKECSCLQLAVHRGDCAVIKELLGKFSDEELSRDFGWSSLMISSFRGDLRAGKESLPLANCASRTKSGITPLMAAVCSGQVSLIDDLIGRGARIETYDRYGRTALHWAIQNGKREAAERIIAVKGNVQELEKQGLSTVITAVKAGDTDMVRLLVDHGARVDVSSRFGATPLGQAAEHGQLGLVRFFLSKGVSAKTGLWSDDLRVEQAPPDRVRDAMRFPQGRGASPHLGFYRLDLPLVMAARSGNREVVELLLASGADINALNREGLTALAAAAAARHQDTVTFLLEKGADVNGGSQSGRPPLRMAAAKGDMPLVTLFLEHRAHIDGGKVHGESPLAAAAENGHADVVALLIERGADVNWAGYRKKTPLHAAAVSGNIEIVKLLLEHGAHVTTDKKTQSNPLAVAARYGHLEIVRLLLQEQPATRSKDIAVGKAIESAAGRDAQQILEMLLPVELDGRVRSYAISKAMENAAKNGQLPLLKWLLEQRQKFGASKIDWAWLLDAAARARQKEAVEMLVHAGADINARHQVYGRSALEGAVASGARSMVDFVLSLGADPDNLTERTRVSLGGRDEAAKLVEKMVERTGKPPTPQSLASVLDQVVIGGSPDAIRYLLELGADPCKMRRTNVRNLAFSLRCDYDALQALELAVSRSKCRGYEPLTWP